MCLITSQVKPVIAEKPIRCYKIVKKIVHDGGETEYRPYFEYNSIVYRIGETFTDTNPFTRSLLNSIERGLHTFSTECNGARSMYEYAIKRRDHYKYKAVTSVFPSERDYYGYCAHDVAFLECEIPAGAQYYEGRCNCMCYFGKENLEQTGYASDKLTPLRELGPEEIARLPYVNINLPDEEDPCKVP